VLIRTQAVPDFVIVDPHRHMPRFWATAWSLTVVGRALSENTRKAKLRHLDRFYQFCDARFGQDSFDDAMSSQDAEKVLCMTETFYLDLTVSPDYNTTDVQAWDSVRGFIRRLALRLAPSKPNWLALSSMLQAMGKLRQPRQGKFSFIRALPKATLLDLLEVAHPGSARNPFVSESIRVRNWLIVNLLLLAGLRRGEALLLACDSLKEDIDPDTGEFVRWLDVTAVWDDDPRSSKPSIKTDMSRRQIPVSDELAELLQHYISEHRAHRAEHGLLLTAQSGFPLSAEACNKVFKTLTSVLCVEARTSLHQKSGGKESISPHDLRHTCATARYAMFMAMSTDRELALQRMRAFFGWSVKSPMPEHYARAAIQEDLMLTWNKLFSEKTDLLRRLPA
jgi:integrase